MPLASVSLVAPITRTVLPCAEMDGVRKAARIFRAALGPARPRGHALPGHSGDWCDLVAAIMPGNGLRPRIGDGAFDRVQTLAGLTAEPALLDRIVQETCGSPRARARCEPAGQPPSPPCRVSDWMRAMRRAISRDLRR